MGGGGGVIFEGQDSGSRKKNQKIGICVALEALQVKGPNIRII